MGEENKVILYGTWSSTYIKRVELALKIKGMPFEYVEENLSNKSDLLSSSDTLYNPVHKKKARGNSSLLRGKQHKREPEYVFERLRGLQEGMKNIQSVRNVKIYKENLGLLDIIMVATLGAYRAHEEFLSVKVIDPEKYPLIFKWITNLVQLRVVKEITPPHDQLVSFLQKLTPQAMKFPTN
ncbi:Glutathione S-transferase U9 [Forsythia ovata]|uniref:Glutathione S-transferase n=1 Tax=Forsythia ovata TaxID=205694 RepID=A0ABD1TT55_9LAMI